MKRLIAGLAAGIMLTLPLSASAKGIGIHHDKAQHIGACYAAELTLREMKPFRNWKPWQRVLFTTIVIGGAKEWYDHNHPSSRRRYRRGISRGRSVADLQNMVNLAKKGVV